MIISVYAKKYLFALQQLNPKIFTRIIDEEKKLMKARKPKYHNEIHKK